MKRIYFSIIVAGCMVMIGSCLGENPEANTSSEDSVQLNNAVPDTINIPSLVTEKESGTLRLTAENGKPLGPKIKYMPEWKAFGYFTTADSVEWEVEVANPGKYNALLEWSVSDEAAGQEFVLIANGKTLTGKVDKSGSWETFKSKDIGTIDLAKGKQKIIFRSKIIFPDGTLLDLRQITLTRQQ